MITSLANIGESLEALAREHNQAKQRGLYVDLVDGTVVSPAAITKDEATRMVATVRGLLDHGGPLADPGFIAWLASSAQDVTEVRGLWWSKVFTGLQQGGPEGMLASLGTLMDETGMTEGFPAMIQEQAQRASAARAAIRKRPQPRRLPRSRRRAD